jgi:transposase
VDVIFERCAGLDVHQETVVACVRKPGDRARQRDGEVRTFSTVMRGLLELKSWLESQGVTHVAMESTGVYWRPVYSVLEGSFELLLVNARHIKGVPGRKTDVRDCAWIAQLLECGLLRASFEEANDHVARFRVVEALHLHLARHSVVRLRLSDTLEQTSELRYEGPKGETYLAICGSRRLGEDTGRDILVHVTNLVERTYSHQKAVLRIRD